MTFDARQALYIAAIVQMVRDRPTMTSTALVSVNGVFQEYRPNVRSWCLVNSQHQDLPHFMSERDRADWMK